MLVWEDPGLDLLVVQSSGQAVDIVMPMWSESTLFPIGKVQLSLLKKHLGHDCVIVMLS